MAATGMTGNTPSGPLAGLKVLDLSRVLAGPWCAQMLGDLGASVYKIEQPGLGDDSRQWGPPFLADGSGDSAYFACTNRNKQSVAIDLARPEGAALVRRLAAECDILIENFRVGGLAKYGLDYARLAEECPRLIYCSITGFGQDGPYRDRGGYDFLIQGMSGLMSVTGQADGPPTKVGLPVCDLSTGLYATISILAALQHRQTSGRGQHIDCCLLDTQVALLANQASAYLNGGAAPQRMGNRHPTLTPYEDFPTADGEVLVVLGNDRQFGTFCRIVGRPDLAEDARFSSNAARRENRAVLREALVGALAGMASADLLAAMDDAGLPGGQVNDVPTILADPHVAARGLVRTMHRDDGTPVQVLGFPAKFSDTPADYRRAPPRTGADTADVLQDLLGLASADIEQLVLGGVLANAVSGTAGPR